MWQTPITDRSASDAEKAQEYWTRGFDNLTASEQSEFMAGMKGSLNTSDLTRIQGNISILSEQLNLKLTVSSVPEYPKETLFTEILSNITAIRSSVEVGTIPEAPINTYTKVNQIEDLLMEVHDILINHYYYCGEIYAGETI